MFWGVAEVDSFYVRPRAVRFKRFIECSLGMRVEVVANQGHFRAIGKARIQRLSNFDRPVGFGPSQACRRLSEARQRFGEHENTGRAIALVLVIDTLALLLCRGD